MYLNVRWYNHDLKSLKREAYLVHMNIVRCKKPRFPQYFIYLKSNQWVFFSLKERNFQIFLVFLSHELSYNVKIRIAVVLFVQQCRNFIIRFEVCRTLQIASSYGCMTCDGDKRGFIKKKMISYQTTMSSSSNCYWNNCILLIGL